MLGGEIPEGPVCLGIELNKDEVPNLNALVTILVHQQAPGISFGGKVDMQLRARPAGSGLSHHPEVVGFVAVNDMNPRVTTGLLEQGLPAIVGFLIELGRVSGARTIDGCIQALGRKSPAVDHKLPGPCNRISLEIIAKGPVPEHLEECVMIGVLSDVLEVVVLAARPNALLRISGSRRGVGRLFRSEKVGHELVHPRIGKKQAGRLRKERRGRHNGVPLLLKEVQEALTNFRGGHGAVIWSRNRG